MLRLARLYRRMREPPSHIRGGHGSAMQRHMCAGQFVEKLLVKEVGLDAHIGGAQVPT
jgi:hypothetical protein